MCRWCCCPKDDSSILPTAEHRTISKKIQEPVISEKYFKSPETADLWPSRCILTFKRPQRKIEVNRKWNIFWWVSDFYTFITYKNICVELPFNSNGAWTFAKWNISLFSSKYHLWVDMSSVFPYSLKAHIDLIKWKCAILD